MVSVNIKCNKNIIGKIKCADVLYYWNDDERHTYKHTPLHYLKLFGERLVHCIPECPNISKGMLKYSSPRNVWSFRITCKYRRTMVMLLKTSVRPLPVSVPILSICTGTCTRADALILKPMPLSPQTKTGFAYVWGRFQCSFVKSLVRFRSGVNL